MLMPAKYYCRKCGKRFIDWGAEKLGFQCPVCAGEELVRVGQTDDKPAKKKPSLKRKVRKVAPVMVPDEAMVSGLDPEVSELDDGLFLARGSKVADADFVMEEDLTGDVVVGSIADGDDEDGLVLDGAAAEETEEVVDED